MLDSKEVSSLIRDEFIQVDQTIEKDAYLRVISPQLLQSEVTLSRFRLDHIIHLAQ